MSITLIELVGALWVAVEFSFRMFSFHHAWDGRIETAQWDMVI